VAVGGLQFIFSLAQKVVNEEVNPTRGDLIQKPVQLPADQITYPFSPGISRQESQARQFFLWVFDPLQ
jgi:hypothetical protein